MRLKKNFFVCPSCGNCSLLFRKKNIKCFSCGTSFKYNGDIPLLFWSNDCDKKTDVTKIIQEFYEKNPFPNYEDIDSIWSLKRKASEGIFTRLLDDQIPRDAVVLEVGCGTGQLSNILGSSWNREVYGVDICLPSLKLADDFRRKSKVKNTRFVQMNLFKPVFKNETFDVVVCSGVLHHTSDPYLGFETLAKLVKPGGYFIVGLYNKIGRLPTDFRRKIFNFSGNRFKFIDPILRAGRLNKKKEETWFLDQYKNPHESKHSMDEVLRWFDENNFNCLNGIPKLSIFDSIDENEELFIESKKGNRVEHLLIQTGMALGGGKEGGFFVMIGKKHV